MKRLLTRARAGLRDAVKPLGEAAVGATTVGLLSAARSFSPEGATVRVALPRRTDVPPQKFDAARIDMLPHRTLRQGDK